jgi:hypothetical protein
MRRSQWCALLVVLALFAGAAVAGGIKDFNVTITSNSVNGASATVDVCTDSSCTSAYPLTCAGGVSVSGTGSQTFLCTAPSGGYKAFTYVMNDGTITCRTSEEPLGATVSCGTATLTLAGGGSTTGSHKKK